MFYGVYCRVKKSSHLSDKDGLEFRDALEQLIWERAKAASEISGRKFAPPLNVYVHITEYGFSCREDESGIHIETPHAPPGQMLAICSLLFSHQWAHRLFGDNVAHKLAALPVAGRALRPFIHHTEYRANEFACRLEPHAYGYMEQIYYAIPRANLRTLDRNAMPSLQKQLTALATQSYASVVEHNIDELRHNKFDSWQDYINHRGEYKNIQSTISHEACNFPR